MISLLERTIEVPDNKTFEPYEWIRFGRKKGVVNKVNFKGEKPDLKDNEHAIPKINYEKQKIVNPRTGRKKNKKLIKYHVTDIPPEKRTLKNLPRHSNNKPIVRFQNWLDIKKFPKLSNKDNYHSWGWGCDGKCYGWSHRAVSGFKKGDVIKPDTIGNKYQYNKSFNNDEEFKKARNFKPYEIKSHKEAEEHAKRFAKDVS